MFNQQSCAGKGDWGTGVVDIVETSFEEERTTVYNVYCAFGDGDSYTVFDHMATCSTIEAAKRVIGSQIDRYRNRINPERFTEANESMTKENNYTYIGNRKDLDEDCGYGCTAGFVIEATTLIK